MAARYRMADPRDAGFATSAGVESPDVDRRNLTPDEVALLRVCATFQGLGAHAAEHIERQLAATARGGLRGVVRKLLSGGAGVPDHREIVARLEALAGEGFLVSDAELAGRLQLLGRDAPPLGRITALGLTTRNRVDCLRRGLLSFIENAKAFGRSIECVVIDDSADEAVRQGNEQMLAGLCRQQDVAIQYAAAPERQAFLEALLAESGVDEEAARFALFGDQRCAITTGSSRNCLLLGIVVGAYVLVDDDCVCRMAPTPGAEPGLAFASGGDPTEIWFYPDRGTVLEQTAFEPADFFGVHEEMLGRALGGLVEQESDLGSLDLDRASPAFYTTLFERGGRVRATVGGIIGDSGIGSTAYLSVNPRSARRLAMSEQTYRQFVESRQVFRAAIRPTVSEGSFCLAGNLGIDNRSLLPPFIPVQRNSDGVFARTLRLCEPSSYLAHPAWGCLHDPETPRKQSMDDYWEDMRRLRFGDVVHLLIAACPAIDPSGGLAASLQHLGAHLVELGALPPPEFEAVARKQVSRTMERLAGAPPPDNTGLPRFYTELQEKHRAAMRDAAARPEFVIPRDLDSSAEDVTLLTQSLISRFGRVCQAWPEINGTASSLRARGVGLTRKIRPV